MTNAPRPGGLASPSGGEAPASGGPVSARGVAAGVKEGDVIAGRYRVEQVIAVGGMGIVLSARHMQLGQRVAIKLLHHDSKQAALRFLTEAKASAQLRSDHIVRVSDVGQLESGEPFMVMELLEGADLAQVLDREGALPVEVAVSYLLEAMEGIAEAHAARIVHRDLKPGNLFRAQHTDGSTVIKVLDFGVSKALSEDVRTAGTVTTTDAVFGSPLYMSPEQMQSATKADERSDVWSLGVVLYELLTRRMPFEAESMAGLAVVIATESPRRLGMHLASAPAELEGVIVKCLAKNPAERYQTVAELAADLEPFAPAARHRVERIQRLILGTTAPPLAVPSAPSLSRIMPPGAETLGPVDSTTGFDAAASPKRSRVLPIAAAVVACVGIAAAGAVLLRRHPPVAPAAAGAPSAVLTPAPPPVTATAPPTATTPPSASVVATASAPAPAHRKPPRHHAWHHVGTASTAAKPTSTSKATTTATAAPTPSLINGISHDRK